MERQLRLHVYPVLGAKQLRHLKPSTIQAWLRGLEGVSTTYVRMMFGNVSSILSAAVDDDLITKNPCRACSVRTPKREPAQIVPWEREWVQAVIDSFARALPDPCNLGRRAGSPPGRSVRTFRE